MEKEEEIKKLKTKYQNMKAQLKSELQIIKEKNQDLAKEAASITKKYEYSKKVVKETKKKLKEYKQVMERSPMGEQDIEDQIDPIPNAEPNLPGMEEMDEEHRELIEVTSQLYEMGQNSVHNFGGEDNYKFENKSIASFQYHNMDMGGAMNNGSQTGFFNDEGNDVIMRGGPQSYLSKSHFSEQRKSEVDIDQFGFNPNQSLPEIDIQETNSPDRKTKSCLKINGHVKRYSASVLQPKQFFQKQKI